MSSPPKRKRRLCRTAFRKLQLLGVYHATTLVATIFGATFWFFEQRRWRVADRLDNERSVK
jgi:hypothetical protein